MEHNREKTGRKKFVGQAVKLVDLTPWFTSLMVKQRLLFLANLFA